MPKIAIKQDKGQKGLEIHFLNKKEYRKHDLHLLDSYINFKAEKADVYLSGKKIFFGISGVKSPDDWREFGFKVAQEIQKLKKVKKITFSREIPKNSQEFFEGLLLGYYSFDRYKKSKSKQKQTYYIKNYQQLRATIRRAQSLVDAQCLTRDLVNTPTCDMTQEDVYKQVQKVFKETDVKVEKYGEKKLKKLNMNGHLAVNSASEHEAMTIKLTFEPKNYKKHIILVGKGLVYDTGGLSLKPTPSMTGMKMDKAGAMTVFGIMKAISNLGSKNKITAYLGLAENAIGPNAYRPGDVITMKNGLTVENLNSDAEGRIVLMDNITLAEEENPKFDMLYTFATLTGAAVNAFGDHTTALTGFNTKAKKQVISTGKKVDELFVDAPFNKYMLDAMKGSITDLTNLSSLGNMGCQTAGLFLTKAFKKEKNVKRYVHCDIAGTAYTTKPWGTNQKGATGATVRTFTKLLK